MKKSLGSARLGSKRFSSLRTEEGEPIYTCNDKYMRWLVRPSRKGGRVCAFNQYFKSKICGDVLKITSKELKAAGKVYDITEAYMKYKNDHLKIIKKEYETKFDDYRETDEEEKKNLSIKC